MSIQHIGALFGLVAACVPPCIIWHLARLPADEKKGLPTLS